MFAFIFLDLNGQNTNYIYDNTNRLIQIDSGNCSGIKFTYDANGNRTGRFAYNIISNAGVTNETCPHAKDGSITLTTSGNVSFLWSNGDTTPVIKNLAPDNYSVVITDKTSGAA
ncbi:MAG TPA: hypothetical protein VHD33_06640 [Legionellaceae bacterium]|nr:hypothetical protein [Legionellaceae bacterium]HWC57896.1 hypothetical protein [Candidatus Paceibacterota bacterium]